MKQRMRTLQLLLLCLGVLLGCLTACGSSGGKKKEESGGALSQSGGENPDSNGTPGGPDGDAQEKPEADSRKLDYARAASTFASEDVVMTVNGQEITWREYYRWLYYILSYIEDQDGAITDWSAPCSLNRKYTVEEYAKFYARATVAQYRVIEQMAAESAVTLTEDQEQKILKKWDSYAKQYGGEDDLVDYLESIYTDKDLYLSSQRISDLYDNLFYARYGEWGKLCTDQQVAEFAAANDYVRIQYLLLKTVDEDNMLLDEQEIKEKKEQIDELYSRITAAKDHVAEFEALYEQYNEDSLAEDYPEGYTRSLSSLSHAEVREVLTTLPEGEVSAPVETGYGYYILYRLPLDYDSIVEYDAKSGEAYTLRYVAAAQLFNDEIAQCLAGAEITCSDALESLNLAQLFATA